MSLSRNIIETIAVVAFVGVWGAALAGELGAGGSLSSTPVVELERMGQHRASDAEKGNAGGGPDLIFRGNFQPQRSIQGVAVTAARTDTDNDTNDPTAPLEGNDTPATAWALPNPFTLGGFVAQSGTGQSGDRFASSADVLDSYSVELSNGQTVELDISDHIAANPDAIDLDLYLYATNDTSTPVAVSNGRGPKEAVQAPNSGSFFLVVEAFAGASNYVMRADSVTSSSAQSIAAIAKSEFVPNEVIVGIKDGQAKHGIEQWLAQFNQKSGGAYSLKRVGGQDTVLLELGDAKSIESTAERFNPLASVKSITARDRVWAAIKNLTQDDAVAFAEPNFIMQPFATVNDPIAPFQWHYGYINLAQAWDVTTGDPNVVTAVIDTGVSGHRDLVGNLTNDGYDLISIPDISRDGNGPDPDASDPGDLNNPDGSSTFHGTHVAGTVGAVSNNNLDVAGVAYGSQIMPIRVLGRGGGTTFDITQGILYSAGVANASGALPNRAADVINMSLGGSMPSQAQQNAVNAARSQNTIVIAAAGNDATSAPAYPSAYAGVVSVSATDASNQLAPYSNFGNPIDVAAPGGNVGVDLTGDGYGDGVLSTVFDDKSGVPVQVIDFKQGTSMAAPHVAGVAALMRSVDADLTPNQFDMLLASGDMTIDVLNDGPGRNNFYGHGLIDAFGAVNAASQGAGSNVPAILQVNPSALNFGSAGNSAELVAANVGGPGTTVNITSVTWNANWLQIGNPSQVNGTLVYPVSVNRSGLVDAVYNDTVVFQTDIPSTVTVPVSMSVGSQDVQFGGKQYLLLVDVDTFDTLGQLTGVPTQSGEYRFQFDNVVEDDYFLFIGTDSDNDGFICDEGEACGAYPDISRPEVVQVGGANVNLPAFTTSYPTSITASAAAKTHRQPLRRLPERK